MYLYLFIYNYVVLCICICIHLFIFPPPLLGAAPLLRPRLPAQAPSPKTVHPVNDNNKHNARTMIITTLRQLNSNISYYDIYIYTYMYINISIYIYIYTHLEIY